MMIYNALCIRGESGNRTIAFAVEELRRYLGRMTGAPVSDRAWERGIEIRVGLMADFPQVTAPPVDDPAMDDAIYISMEDGKGIVAGINPRSALLAAYRLLTELGCRWVRPGKDGEVVPRIEAIPSLRIAETASYRHRGVCIEGAVSEEHVRDMIDWAPKVGFNAYFTQFREAYTFFDRWYSHLDNPGMPGEKLSIEKAREYLAAVVDEIKKRDLLYHAVGHGWTCEPFGIPGLGWDSQEDTVPDSVRKYLAEVKGERKLWGGVALNTNLCYSNPEARRIMIEDIARYAAEHPEIDLLHLWLADGMNNNCECPECRKGRPSDFYVVMLNELDRLLSERGLSTRIVFLIYVDLLWPPTWAKLENPGRFVLMFAPIARTYSQAFSPSAELPELPPFKRNELEFPKGVDANVAFLKAWQEVFQGDSFDFDYHLMWDYQRDPGFLLISDIISQDMKGLRGIGLNGYVSCQPQRLFLPTGLPMTVMGRTLWDAGLDYQAITEDYLQAAFGPDWKLCRDYLAKLGELFDPVYLRLEKPTVSPEAAEKLGQVAGVVEAFRPVIERNEKGDIPAQAKSWHYLKLHAGIVTGLAEALRLRATGDRESARKRWEQVQQTARELEPELHPVMDTWEFNNSTFAWLFGSDR